METNVTFAVLSSPKPKIDAYIWNNAVDTEKNVIKTLKLHSWLSRESFMMEAKIARLWRCRSLGLFFKWVIFAWFNA